MGGGWPSAAIAWLARKPSFAIMPVSASDVKPPQDIIFDGFDLLPVLQGKTPSTRNAMFWQRRNDVGARVGDWKWVDSSRGSGRG